MINFYKFCYISFILSIVPMQLSLSNEYKVNQNVFIENKGQLKTFYGASSNEIFFYYGNHSVRAYFHKSGIIYSFQSIANNDNLYSQELTSTIKDHGIRDITSSTTSLNFIGSNPNTRVIGLNPTGITFNYYYPHCTQGVTGVKSFNIIKYENLYNNIDLIVFSRNVNTGFKYEFIVKPGGNVFDIKIEYSGETYVRLKNDGCIEIKNECGKIEELAPYSYQFNNEEINLTDIIEKQQNETLQNLSASSSIKKIESRFVISKNKIQFEISDYDSSKLIIIDPDIKWSTYFGGSGGDLGKSVVIDNNEDIIIHGWTISLNLPVTGDAYQKYRGGIFDSFLAKFDAFGKLQWATYFGGLDTDYGQDVCVDNGRNIYITGFTWSRDFPITPNALQTTFGGGNDETDGFIAKFDPDGQRLWSTYYGGLNSDHFYGIAINDNEELALTGWTESFNFLRSENSPGLNSWEDAFVVRLKSDGGFISSYLLGGNGSDIGQDVVYDNFGNIVIAGFTDSKDFPLEPKPLSSEDKAIVEKKDAFVAKFNNDDSSSHIEFSYVFGGSENDEAYSAALDKDGNIYITGMTESQNFRVTNAAYQKFKSAESDVFATKLSKFGKLIWSTFLGGADKDWGYDIKTDSFLNVIVCGRTESPNFPTSKGAVDKELNGKSDAYVSKLSMGGDKLLWSTLIGGSNQEDALAMALDRMNHIVVTGSTDSKDFPVVFKPEQDTLSGFYDAFIFKLCSNEPLPVIKVNGPTIFCPGDSAILDAGPEWRWFRWNNGATTRRLVVKSKGYYHVTVTDTNGCTGSSDSVFIDLHHLEKPVFTGEKGFCKGDSTTIGIQQEFVSYSWSNGKKTKEIIVNKAGWYYVTITDKNGCKITDSVKVIQYYEPDPTIRGPKIVCRESKKVIYFVTGIPSEKYSWNVEGGVIDYGADSVNIYVDWGAAGIGKIYVKAVNYITGCIGYDTLIVTISDHLEPEITSTNNDSFVICEGDSLILDAGDGYATYLWNDNSTDRFLKVNKSGNYWVYVTDAIGCEGCDTAFVSVYPRPAPVISGDNSLCEFSDGIIYQTPYVFGNTYKWTITGGKITNGDGTNRITVKWDSAGNGTLQVLEKVETTGCETQSEIFNVIIHKTPVTSILVNGNREFCDGDSVQLIADGNYSQFRWSNGVNTKSIWIKSSGIYWLVVYDDNGCFGFSPDSITVVVHPVPEKPVIIRTNDTLYSSSGNNYQWYLNNNPIPGAVSANYYPIENGIYKVIVSNDFGCSNESEDFDYWRGIAYITLALPDTVFAPTGVRIKIPLEITKSLNLRKVGAETFTGYFSYNSTVLLPLDNNLIYTQPGNFNQFKFNGSLNDTLGHLREFEFYTAWGNSQCSPITLDSITWNIKNIETKISSGVFCLFDICFAAGRRLFFDSDIIELKQNIPNPFDGTTEIEYSVIEKAHTRLFITDMMGKKVVTLFDDVIEPGKYLINFDASELSQGLYLYILQTPTTILTRRMQVVR